jgi:SAM-dependent methyltransferase
MQMSQSPIRFDDGAAYERGMGVWSRIAGEVFLDWLAPALGWRWVDVGCGNGAFTELLMQHHAPAEAQGIDPSGPQLAFARTRPGAAGAAFQEGDAMALPFEADRFDAAVMALVIFFVPEPVRGVAEMVRPGGLVAAYAWDMAGGGFPFGPVQEEFRSMGFTPAMPPSADASRIDVLRGLWRAAGLTAVETREITVQRQFADFEDFWASTTGMGNQKATLAQMTPADVEAMKARLRAALPADASGRVTHTARANAIRGIMPG